MLKRYVGDRAFYGRIFAVYLPISFLLSRFTDLPFLAIYAICNSTDLIKCIVGTILIRSGTWIQQLTRSKSEKESSQPS